MQLVLRSILFGTVLSALLIACGGASDSSAAGLKRELVGTSWSVVSMTGFPGDNLVEGSFSFGTDRFRFQDGVNDAWSSIRWTKDGFAVENDGVSTAAGYHDGPRSYFNTFSKVDTTIRVVISANRMQLTLSRDDLVVVAVRLPDAPNP